MTTDVDVRGLSPASFTDSDIARIAMVAASESRAGKYGEFAQMVGEDLAQAGDYVRTRWLWRTR